MCFYNIASTMLILTAVISAIVCSVTSGFPEVKLSKKIYNLDDSKALFEEFIVAHNKQYKNEEEYSKRHSVFKQNLKEINEQNEKDPYAMYGINDMTDLTFDEFLEFRTGFNFSMAKDYDVKPYVPSGGAPDSIDWRKKNAVTPVKDATKTFCYTDNIFSAIGNIEGQYAIKHGKLVSLSEQQALDCGITVSCNSGSAKDIMNSIAQHGGSETEKDYPYNGSKGVCHADPSKIVVKVTGGSQLGIQEDGLEDAVATLGPIASVVGINRAFQSYSGGILSERICPSTLVATLDILIVGYGSENGVKYWIVKNCWGTKWGEKGYIRIERDAGACAIGSMNFQSTIQ